MKRVVALVFVLLFLCAPRVIVQAKDGNGGSNDPPPDVVLKGARSVTIWNGLGGVSRLTSIPGSSEFAKHGGGRKAQCTFHATHDDFKLSDGRRVPRGTEVTSDYLFVEGIHTSPVPAAPDEFDDAPTRGPLANATRTFTVFCDLTSNEINFVRIINVPMTDTTFDTLGQLDQLRNDLQLARPVVFTNPVVDRFGGLVTRYPAWLAIHPDGWVSHRSNLVVYRGVRMYLYADPRELEFVVDFEPNPDKPSPAFRGLIGCIPTLDPTTDGVALPALPVLPEQSDPGPNGPCMWTPPGPGTVTITAQITYTITFWANGYTQPDSDHTWQSNPTTYLTGELTAVNTNPTP